MGRTGWRRWTRCSGRCLSLWCRGFIRRFRCIRRFLRMRSFVRGSSIRSLWSGSSSGRRIASQRVSESASQQRFPRLYPIVDAALLAARGVETLRFAEELRAAEVELLQYRNKAGGPQEVLRNAVLIREVMVGSRSEEHTSELQ